MKKLTKKSIEKTVVAYRRCTCKRASKANCYQIFGSYGTSAVTSANSNTTKYR